MERVYLTVDEAAAHYRVSRQTIRRLIHRGELRAIRVGERLLIPKNALADFEQNATAS